MRNNQPAARVVAIVSSSSWWNGGLDFAVVGRLDSPSEVEASLLDRLERGLSDRYGLRFISVDVTETAGILAERHGCGPAAAEVLSLAVGAVALLASELENEQECISVQWALDGPIGGILMEGAHGGRLRGYPYQKTLGELDDRDAVDRRAVMGKGEFTVIQSVPGNLIYSARLAADPADIENNLARFYNQSRQTPTAVALHVARENSRVTRAAGLLVQKMPDGTTEQFVDVLERFDSGEIHRGLAAGSGVAQLGIDDLIVVSGGNLGFACRCSREKIRSVISSLPTQDLAEMVAEDRPQTITCHFCGEAYVIGQEELRELASATTGTPSP